MNAKHLLPLISLAAALSSQAAPIDRFDSSFELIDASDVSLFQASAMTVSRADTWETNLSLSASDFSFDYEPVSFDFNGISRSRSESNFAFQSNTRKDISENATILFGAGAYDGYNNYRSAWLDEYYRQQFSDLQGVPGAENYVDASPKGYNLSAGLRWMYRPNSAYAQISISQLQDDIAPGYEIDFDGLRRGELVLATSAISVSTENILTKRIRSLVTLRASETSARDVRYSAEIALNAALGERWIARAQAGASTENPQFDAHYANLAIEYEVNENVSLYLDGRYYTDTGEIENSLFTAAAPGVTSRKLGLGVKWAGKKWNGRFYIAPIGSRFEEIPGNVDAFGNLYKDRDWTVFQLAFSREY